MSESPYAIIKLRVKNFIASKNVRSHVKFFPTKKLTTPRCSMVLQGRRPLVTAATSVQSCAYRSLCITIKLDSAAI